MSIRKKKSLTIVIFGLALFLFTFSIQKSQIGYANTNNGRSQQSLETSRKVSLEKKASDVLQDLKSVYNSHGNAYDTGRPSKEERLQVISLQDSGKPSRYRRNFMEDKTTVGRDFLSKTKTESGEMKKRFPTTIILGVKKAGTRALLDILRMHPHVIGASNEVYFFNGYHTNGLEWYRQQMPLSSPGQMTIEKSPTYFTSVKNTQIVNRMFIFSRSTDERLKLLVVVRDPVKRCISEYTDLVARSKKDEIPAVNDFKKLIFHENGTINAESELVKTGLYVEHLKKWLEYFLESEIHFVSGEELVRNPYKEIKAVETFLELEPFFTEKNFRFDELKGFPCFLPDPSTNNESYCLPPNKGRKHADVKQTTFERLRSFYQPFNKQFYFTVKRNFQWS